MADLDERAAAALMAKTLDEVGKAVVGQRDAVRLVLMTVLARGHVLIEDLPGLGKTMLARSLARALGLTFARVQFTPDLLPQDLTGTLVFDQRDSDFQFRPGPVFTQFLLADEINRTPPKTQAALLEAMAEQQVTTDGQTRRLPDPFVVVATSNPIEFEGTYALPEAQLDRFTARIRLGYLDPEVEADMLQGRLTERVDEHAISSVVTADELVAARRLRAQVEIHPSVVDYIVSLLAGTRRHSKVSVGASPRGGLALGALAQAAALMAGRTFVLPDDVKQVAIVALGHRIVVRPELWASRTTGDSVVAEVLSSIATPAARPR
ncbi:MAG: AAA family ATPase [Nocardioidaceae bacterium]